MPATGNDGGARTLVLELEGRWPCPAPFNIRLSDTATWSGDGARCSKDSKEATPAATALCGRSYPTFESKAPPPGDCTSQLCNRSAVCNGPAVICANCRNTSLGLVPLQMHTAPATNLATGRSMCLRLPELRARARMAATPGLGNREKSPGKTTREADRKITSGSSWGLRMRRPPSAAAHAERARGKCLAPAERDDLHRAPFRAHGQIV
jgi:hypothetical protein